MKDDSINRLTHKILISKTPKYLYNVFTINRNQRQKDENKIANLPQDFGFTPTDKQTFIYKAKVSFNALPVNLTSMQQIHRFKSWLKKYRKNPTINIPTLQQYNKFWEDQIRKKYKTIFVNHSMDNNTQSVNQSDRCQ